MQNNNELTLTLATLSAINVLYFYRTSSTYNTHEVTNVNKNTAPRYNWAIHNSMLMEFNNYIKDT